MKYTLLLAFYLFLVKTTYSQIREFQFGEVDKSDLEMTHYALDSGASAVILLDQGSAYYEETNNTMVLKHHIRLKILKESGLDKADITLRYIKGYNPIQKIKSITHNLENGEVVKTNVSKKQWTNEQINDKLYARKLSFPNAKVGSIIEYTYTQVMGDVFNLPAWTFQTSIPVRYSEYICFIPKYGTYQLNFKGYQPTSYEDINGEFYHFRMENIPALDREPYISSLENYRAKVEFECKKIQTPTFSRRFMETWNVINTELYESDAIGDIFYNDRIVRSIYPEDKGWKKDKQSLIEIYEYIRDHFEWNNRNAYTVVDRSKKLWEEGVGDNADINFTLGQFLKRAGFTTFPVMLSTRSNGYLNKFIPLIKQFNYMIVCVELDGKNILLDATDKHRPHNVLPDRVLNGEGLLVNQIGARWIGLNTNKELNAKMVSAEFSLDDDLEEMAGQVSVTFRSSAASDLREVILEEQEKAVSEGEEEDDKEEEEGDKSTVDDYKTGEVENLEVKGLKDYRSDLRLTYNFSESESFTLVSDKIFFSPLLIKHVEENPFKLEERNYPVELPAPIAHSYSYKIKIPEGYVLEELPETVNLVLPNKGGRFMFITDQASEDEIQLMMKVNLFKTQYLPEEYPALKEFFNLIIAKQQEQVVLKEASE